MHLAANVLILDDFLIYFFLNRFNGLEFLLKMKGKTVMFVGDSLGRDQWESLICMISADVPKSQTQMSRLYPISTFKFLVLTLSSWFLYILSI